MNNRPLLQPLDKTMRIFHRSSLFVLVLLSLVTGWCLEASAQVEVQVPGHDGTLLATDIYLPEGSGTFPVVLIRTPYNKAAHADFGAGLSALGFVGVMQDMRGRFASDGTDSAFADDKADGLATLDWIAAQEWSNGEVAMMGGSALGIAQYLVADQGHEALACIMPLVATPNFYEHAVFPGGVFRPELVEDWLTGQGSLFLLPELIEHPLSGSYWASRSGQDYANVRAGGLHIGGWYDIFSQGTIDAFVGYQGQSAAPDMQHLVMGPWTHGALFTQAQGELTYPENATLGEDAYIDLTLAWLQACLLNDPTAIQDWPPVYYYLMGDVDDPEAPGNVWRGAETWPPMETTSLPFYLNAQGELVDTLGESGSLSFSSDPLDPVPTLGGNNLTLGAGPYDQRPLEQRDDLLVFTSPELVEPLEVVGRVSMRVHLSIDQPDADLMVRLSDVYPDGRSILVADGALRLRHREGSEREVLVTPGESMEVEVDLWSTAIVFNAGHRIRVSLAGSNSRRFEVNPQSGEPLRQHTELRIAEFTIQYGDATPSALYLPVANAPGPDPELEGVEEVGEVETLDIMEVMEHDITEAADLSGELSEPMDTIEATDSSSAEDASLETQLDFSPDTDDATSAELAGEVPSESDGSSDEGCSCNTRRRAANPALGIVLLSLLALYGLRRRNGALG